MANMGAPQVYKGILYTLSCPDGERESLLGVVVPASELGEEKIIRRTIGVGSAPLALTHTREFPSEVECELRQLLRGSQGHRLEIIRWPAAFYRCRIFRYSPETTHDVPGLGALMRVSHYEIWDTLANPWEGNEAGVVPEGECVWLMASVSQLLLRARASEHATRMSLPPLGLKPACGTPHGI